MVSAIECLSMSDVVFHIHLHLYFILGSHHLHVLVHFKKQFQTRLRDYFDFLCKKHGNYQTVRSIFAVVNYLRKEDPEPLQFGELLDPASEQAKQMIQNKKKATGSHSQSKATWTARASLSGSSLQQILLHFLNLHIEFSFLFFLNRAYLLIYADEYLI